MKHQVRRDVRCPYYKHEDSQVIYCTGFEPGITIHLAFANKTDALEYKMLRCRRDYLSCPIEQMLEEWTEDG